MSDTAIELDPWTTKTIECIDALADDYDHDGIDALLAEVTGAQARPGWRLLVEALERASLGDRAIAIVERVDPLVAEPVERIELLLVWAKALCASGRTEEATVQLRRAEVLADPRQDDLTARVHLAALDDRERHARIALEAARDPELRERATSIVGNALFDRGELEQAERLVVGLPALGTRTRALHEHILRRQGRLGDEPDESDLPFDPDPLVGPQHVSDDVVAYFTPPGPDVASWASTHPLRYSALEAASYGEVSTEDDLDSQRIFGPAQPFVCACGRYRGRRYRGVVCECCGVDVIDRTARRHRIGHLRLATPVLHPWFVEPAARLLEMAPSALHALPGAEVRALLDDHDFEAFASELLVTFDESSAPERDELAPLVDLVRALRARMTFRSSDLALDAVLVLGPDAELPGVDMGAVRAAYRRILAEDDPRPGVEALFACFPAR